MHEKRTASIQFLILCLIIWCALWSEKYGNAKGFIKSYFCTRWKNFIWD